MPLAFDPEARFDVVLATDAAKATDHRPTFHCRFMSEREYWRFEDLGELVAGQEKAALAAPDEATRNVRRREASRVLEQGLAVCLVGWSNVLGRDGRPVRFGVDLGEVLSYAEKAELWGRILVGVMLSEMDRKKSASGSDSASAPGADPESAPPAAGAGTASTPPSPPSSSAAFVAATLPPAAGPVAGAVTGS